MYARDRRRWCVNVRRRLECMYIRVAGCMDVFRAGCMHTRMAVRRPERRIGLKVCRKATRVGGYTMVAGKGSSLSLHANSRTHATLCTASSLHAHPSHGS
eukprot:5942836-Pleurochrysis_carterae.AAC.2